MYLTLDVVTGISDDDLYKIISQNPNLEFLKLSELSRVSGAGYRNFGKLSNLKILHLMGRWKREYEEEVDNTWMGCSDEILDILAENLSVETVIFSEKNSFTLNGIRRFLMRVSVEHRDDDVVDHLHFVNGDDDEGIDEGADEGDSLSSSHGSHSSSSSPIFSPSFLHRSTPLSSFSSSTIPPKRVLLKTLIIGKIDGEELQEVVPILREEFPHVQIGQGSKRVRVTKHN